MISGLVFIVIGIVCLLYRYVWRREYVAESFCDECRDFCLPLWVVSWILGGGMLVTHFFPAVWTLH